MTLRLHPVDELVPVSLPLQLGGALAGVLPVVGDDPFADEGRETITFGELPDAIHAAGDAVGFRVVSAVDVGGVGWVSHEAVNPLGSAIPDLYRVGLAVGAPYGQVPTADAPFGGAGTWLTCKDGTTPCYSDVGPGAGFAVDSETITILPGGGVRLVPGVTYFLVNLGLPTNIQTGLHWPQGSVGVVTGSLDSTTFRYTVGGVGGAYGTWNFHTAGLQWTDFALYARAARVVGSERVQGNTFPTHIDQINSGVSAYLFRPVKDLLVVKADTAWDGTPGGYPDLDDAHPRALRVGIASGILVGTVPTLADPSGGSGGGWVIGVDGSSQAFVDLNIADISVGGSSGPPWSNAVRTVVTLPGTRGFMLRAGVTYSFVVMHKTVVNPSPGNSQYNYVLTRTSVPTITWPAELEGYIVRVNSAGVALPGPTGGGSGSVLSESTQHAQPDWGSMVDDSSAAGDFSLFGIPADELGPAGLVGQALSSVRGVRMVPRRLP